MASSVTAIGAILLADVGITGLVAQRVFNKRLPDKVTYPAIAYRKVVKVPRLNHDGASSRFDIRVQVSCYGLSDAVDAVYKAARAALDNVAAGTYNGINTTGVQYIDDVDEYDDDTEKDVIKFDVKLFVVE